MESKELRPQEPTPEFFSIDNLSMASIYAVQAQAQILFDTIRARDERIKVLEKTIEGFENCLSTEQSDRKELLKMAEKKVQEQSQLIRELNKVLFLYAVRSDIGHIAGIVDVLAKAQQYLKEGEGG